MVGVVGSSQLICVSCMHAHMHIQYRGLNESHKIIVWFWRLVHSLKEEEKALLLKFATGSPRVPASGFASLQVLFPECCPVRNSCACNLNSFC